MNPPISYDYTMLSTFLRCRRRYYWRIVRGLVGKKPPTAAEFGRCIHKALDVWYETHDVNKAIDTFSVSFKEDITDAKRTLAVGKKMLQLYAEKYAHQPFKVLATEYGFDVPLPHDEARLIGRIDKIVEWDGGIYVLDHKTTSRLGYEFFYKIKPNMQFDGYIWAVQQCGFNCTGVVIDAILVAKGLCVPAQLSRLTPLARDVSNRSEEEIHEYMKNIMCIISDIETCYQTDTWYQNTEGCCDFVQCPYRAICKEETALHDRIANMDYKVEMWNPLEHAKTGEVNKKDAKTVV